MKYEVIQIYISVKIISKLGFFIPYQKYITNNFELACIVFFMYIIYSLSLFQRHLILEKKQKAIES